MWCGEEEQEEEEEEEEEEEVRETAYCIQYVLPNYYSDKLK